MEMNKNQYAMKRYRDKLKKLKKNENRLDVK